MTNLRLKTMTVSNTNEAGLRMKPNIPDKLPPEISELPYEGGILDRLDRLEKIAEEAINDGIMSKEQDARENCYQLGYREGFRDCELVRRLLEEKAMRKALK
jgi:flagellar biosynthesis/type III secretory pathway protein FliH